ncbi:alpha-L-fucosidase [Luteolibacter luteus]|uniref:alpha-L-fucosidase n=1 Tax=Luteolibacter luteus TaxID=2728835 RepID=A0A858RDD7_9BACT|nr:alpha-L-fucosidase [Luteolibacter luteus]QJE95076.1 hypothetical protein HHL09_04570 [Luteolibacter luteus]
MAAAMVCGAARAQDDIQMTPYAGAAKWESDREQRLAWFREARFGLLLHLGLYSGAAGHWPPDQQNVRQDERQHPEWLRNWAAIPDAEYQRLLKPLFQPAPGCTDEWAQLARDAGMRYAILSAKSEEGYTLFNSADTATNISPPGRDLFGEFVASLRKQQLMPGVYYSLVDWHHSDPKTYPQYVKQHFRELATGYGPLGILWADGSTATAEGARWGTKSLLETWREYQPASVIDNRFWSGLENPNGDFMTPEDYVLPAAIDGRMFEVRSTMNDHLGYAGENVRWKTPREILLLLSEIASKGGNLLLGIGPDAKGRIPAGASANLRATGEWLKTHGEAIYGTTGTPFLAPVFNGRCTVGHRDGAYILYCHLHEWPTAGMISLDGLSTRCVSAVLMGKEPLNLEVNNVSWPTIRLPQSPPDKDNPLPIIAARLEREPVIDPIPYPLQGVDRTVTLNAAQAILVPGPGTKTPLRLEREHIGFWSQKADSVWFPVIMKNPGKFRVVLDIAVARPCGGEIEVRILDQVLRLKIGPTGESWDTFREVEAGEVKLTQTGLHAIHIRPIQIEGYGLMNLRTVRLLPIDDGE